MAPRFELDKWPVARLYELWKKGRLDIRPEWQRSEVWPERMKYALIDTTVHDWPMGLVMINVTEHADADNTPVEYYQVVDGQQRLATLFAYKDGQADWGRKPALKGPEFTPYAQLSPSRQERVDQYLVAIALMREYEQDDILDVYSRLQNSKPLMIGEKVKALRTAFKPYIKELLGHRIFRLANNKHQVRDAHWNLASVFFKSVYRNNPLDRQEYPQLEDFLKHEPLKPDKAKRAVAETGRLLNMQNRVIQEALEIDPSFEDAVASARLLKWLFVALCLLSSRYGLSGKEHLAAKGLLAYYRAKDKEASDEWVAYLNTGRTGRIDTDDVRACLEQLMNRIVIEADAEPLDQKRFFSASQRMEILKKSKGRCAHCEIELSKTNFHADHVKPHRYGGQTTVENGQALCTACNRKKGGSPELFV